MISFLKKKLWGWFGTPLVSPVTFKVAGQKVNKDSIMQLSAAWACTRLISETIGTLPIHIYRRKEDGSRERADGHPLNRILKIKANSDSLASTYWQANVANLLLSGNCISRKLFYNGELVGLKLIPPEKLQAVYDGSKITIYEINKNGEKKQLKDKDIFKTTGFSLDGVWGCSVIEYGSEVFGSALGASGSANNTFKNGLMPTTVFTTDKTLTKDHREALRKQTEGLSSAMQAGRSLFLESGFKADTLSVNPRDAQLLESRGFSVEEICRMFGVDPSMIGHGKSVSNWGTGLEQKMSAFLIFTLRSWLTRIEQAINSQLLPVEDQLTYYAEYNVEGLLRADSVQRAQYLRILTDAGIMTRDEARTKENLPAMGGNAGVLMVNSATQPIDSLGVQNED